MSLPSMSSIIERIIDLVAGVIGGLMAVLIGLIHGAHPQAIALGFAGSLLATMMIEKIDNPTKSAASVLLSSLAAGYMSPLIANYIANAHPEVVMSPDHSYLIRGCALLIGTITPWGFPLIIAIIKRRGK